MKTILLVRRKKDYYLTSNTSDWYSDYMSNVWSVNDKIKMWDKLFSISFLEMRKELNRIAFLNLDQLGFDYVFDHISNENISKILEIKNAWFVPVDDDDWISINLSKALKSLNTNQNLCHWRATFLDFSSPNIYRVERRNASEIIPSCCYAVHSDLLDRNSFWKVIDHGWTIGKQRYFLENIESIYLKTPTSSYMMKNKINNIKEMATMANKIKKLDPQRISDEFKIKTNLLINLFSNCKIKKIFM